MKPSDCILKRSGQNRIDGAKTQKIINYLKEKYQPLAIVTSPMETERLSAEEKGAWQQDVH